MAYHTGRSGSIKLGAETVARVRDWSLETTVELLSINTIASSANEFTPGVKGATGSATLLYYNDASNRDFRDLIGKVLKKGAIVQDNDVNEMTLKVHDDASIKFNAFITSASISVSNNELTVVPINFTVQGDFMEAPVF